MNTFPNTRRQPTVPFPTIIPDRKQIGVPLSRREREFFLLLSAHRWQKRPVMQLDLDLCDLARNHAEREIARHKPESILLFLWKTALRDDLFPGLTRSYTLLHGTEDNSHKALATFLDNPADGRHLLGGNMLFKRHSRIGVGYATDPRGEMACYVFISAEAQECRHTA